MGKSIKVITATPLPLLLAPAVAIGLVLAPWVQAAASAVPTTAHDYHGAWHLASGTMFVVNLHLDSLDPVEGAITWGLCKADWHEVHRISDTERLVASHVTSSELPSDEAQCTDNTWDLTLAADSITATDKSGSPAHASFTPFTPLG